MEPSSRSRLRYLLFIGVPLLMVGGLLLVVVTFHIRHLQRYFIERNVRALGVLADHTQASIESLQAAVGNAVSASAQYQRLSNSKTSGVASTKCKFATNFAAKVRLVPGLQVTEFDGGTDPACVVEKRPSACLRTEAGGPGPLQTTLAGRRSVAFGVQETAEVTSTELHFCHPKPLEDLQGDACADERTRSHACAAISLSRIVDQRLAGTPLATLDVFLADSSGRVLYERGASGFRIGSLHEKDGAEPAAKDTLPLGMPPIAALLRSTTVQSVSLDGTAFTLLTQPFHVHRASASEELWVLGALAPIESWGAQSSVSLAAMVAIPLLVVIALVALPFLRWATTGPREAMSPWTVLQMAAALVAGTALLTAVTLVWYTYAGMSGLADAELRRFSDALVRNFTAERRAATDTLAAFVKQRLDAAHGDDKTLGKGYVVCRRALGKLVCYDDESAAAQDDDALRRIFQRYPHFEMLTFADQDGEQKEKWTVRRSTTAFINVAELSFFRDAVDGRSVAPGPGEPPSGAVLTVTKSPNTGEMLTVVSLPVLETAVEPPVPRGVATLVSHVVSLDAPAVPADVGYAVVENNGRVLFHSEPGRRLYENFLAECDSPGRLQSAVLSRRAELDDLTYYGRPRRAFVQPLPGTPWSLIVFRDKEVYRTVGLEIGLTAGVWFALCLLLYGLTAWMLRLALNDGGAHLWPDRRNAIAYVRCALLLALLATWSGWAIHAFEPIGALLASTLAPLWALTLIPLAFCGPQAWRAGRRRVVLGWVALVWLAAVVLSVASGDLVAMGLVVLAAAVQIALLRLRAQADGEPLLSYDYAYAAVGVLLLINLAVVPTIALVSDAADLAGETLVRRRQLALDERLVEHGAALRARYADVDGRAVAERGLLATGWDLSGLDAFSPSTSASWRLAGDRRDAGASAIAADPVARPHPLLSWLCGTADDACADGGAAQAADGGPGESCALSVRHPTAALQTVWPIYSQESLELRHAIYERASDCSWRLPGPAGDLVPVHWVRDPRAQIDPTGRTATPDLALTPPLYSLGWPSRGLRPFMVLLGAALFGAALATVRALIVRLFGLRVAEPAAGADGAAQGALGRLFVRPDAALVSELERDALVVDLCRVTLPEGLPGPDTISGTRVVLGELERCLAAPEWKAAVLGWLERLVFDRHLAVDLISSEPPTRYFAERAPAGGGPPAEPPVGPERGRWVRLLASLQTIPPLQPSSAPQPQPDWEQNLDEECRWTARLRGIAQEARQDERWARLDREELIRGIGEAAAAYYRSLWERLSDEERLVLIHVARQGFVSPRAWPAVRSLIGQRLVRRDPALRIMNESFRRFVLQAEEHATVKSWERAGGANAWGWLPNAITAAAVVAAVLLFVMQPDALTTWITFLGAIGTVGAKLTDILGLFQAQRREAH
jgi:hypothetical protein